MRTDDAAIRHVLRLALEGCDLGPDEFSGVRAVTEACGGDAPPAFVFLDVALKGFDAIDVIRALGAISLSIGIRSGPRIGIQKGPPLLTF
jgi:DNA-binding NtrC family response regulator